MKIKVNTFLLYGLIIGLVLAIFFSGYRIASKKKDNAYNGHMSELCEVINKYSITIDGLKVSVAEKSQEVMSLREAIKQGEIEKEELRKLNIKRLNEITKLKLRIDTLLQIPPDTTVIVIDTCNGKPSLRLPYSFSKKDEYLTLNGTIDTRGMLGLGIAMEIPLDLWTGIDKDTKQPKAAVTTPNTYVTTISLRSYKFDTVKPKKWGIGFQMGYGVSVKRAEFSPFIGIGVNRNLIRF